MTDLSPGDFLYQADQELFLAVIENNENTVDFSVHGWRTIDKERLGTYLDADNPVIHTEEQVEQVVAEADDPRAEEKLEWLKQIFEQYEEAEIAEDSAHKDFTLEDT